MISLFMMIQILNKKIHNTLKMHILHLTTPQATLMKNIFIQLKIYLYLKKDKVLKLSKKKMKTLKAVAIAIANRAKITKQVHILNPHLKWKTISKKTQKKIPLYQNKVNLKKVKLKKNTNTNLIQIKPILKIKKTNNKKTLIKKTLWLNILNPLLLNPPFVTVSKKSIKILNKKKIPSDQKISFINHSKNLKTSLLKYSKKSTVFPKKQHFPELNLIPI
jgi:hypothetical protein